MYIQCALHVDKSKLGFLSSSKNQFSPPGGTVRLSHRACKAGKEEPKLYPRESGHSPTVAPPSSVTLSMSISCQVPSHLSTGNSNNNNNKKSNNNDSRS